MDGMIQRAQATISSYTSIALSKMKSMWSGKKVSQGSASSTTDKAQKVRTSSLSSSASPVTPHHASKSNFFSNMGNKMAQLFGKSVPSQAAVHAPENDDKMEAEDFKLFMGSVNTMLNEIRDNPTMAGSDKKVAFDEMEKKATRPEFTEVQKKKLTAAVTLARQEAFISRINDIIYTLTPSNLFFSQACRQALRFINNPEPYYNTGQEYLTQEQKDRLNDAVIKSISICDDDKKEGIKTDLTTGDWGVASWGKLLEAVKPKAEAEKDEEAEWTQAIDNERASRAQEDNEIN